jgi:IS6 family transposase
MPSSWHVETSRSTDANQSSSTKPSGEPLEADHGRHKHRLRPSDAPAPHDRAATVIIAGHALVQNIRRGHYEPGIDAPLALRLRAAFAELAAAI